MKAASTAAAVLVAAVAGTAAAQTAQFTSIGSAEGGPQHREADSQAWAITRDGAIVTGKTTAEIDGEAEVFGYQYDTTTGEGTVLEGVKSLDVFSASGDGTRIVGMGFLEDPRQEGEFNITGFEYTQSEGVELILSPQLDTDSTAMDVSADGTTVAGEINHLRDFSSGFETSDAYVRTESGGVQILADVQNGIDLRFALETDGDGSHAAGMAETSTGRVAVVWETEELTPSVIPEAPGNAGSQYATTMSDNGRYVAGAVLSQFTSPTEFTEDPFLYDRETGEVTRLFETPSEYFSAIPAAVSDDGSTVVGTLNEFQWYDFPSGRAFIWTEQDGFRTLEEALAQDHGLDPDWELTNAKDMSADSSKIVGDAERVVDGMRFNQGYVVELNTVESCPADIAGAPDGGPDGSVTSEDFLAFIDLFAQGNPEADFNADQQITSADFLAYIDAFAQGCP